MVGGGAELAGLAAPGPGRQVPVIVVLLVHLGPDAAAALVPDAVRLAVDRQVGQLVCGQPNDIILVWRPRCHGYKSAEAFNFANLKPLLEKLSE